VYCCHPCNEFKGDYWQPNSPQRILHPLRDPIGAHFDEQEDGTLRAFSVTGAFHIERLHLNRLQLVEHRRERRLLETAHQTQTRVLESLKELEHQVRTLTAELERLERGDADS
jgi:hypothetical protein